MQKKIVSVDGSCSVCGAIISNKKLSFLKKKTKKFVYIKYYMLFCHVNTNIKR